MSAVLPAQRESCHHEMKQMKHIPFFSLILLLTVLLFSSCHEKEIIGYVDYTPRIVVEGSIESNQPAMVTLSISGSFDQKIDTAFLLNHVIRSAKVSVSDGNQTEVLTLGTNWDYLPPYVYYGTDLKGEIGKSYRLTIEYQEKIIQAETYIPAPVALESYTFTKENPADTTGHIHIRFNNTSDLYYQITTRVDEKENVYTPCLYGNFSAAQFEKGKNVDLQVSKGPILYPKVQVSTSFVEGDVVYMKFKTMPKHGYDFWNSWQNEVVNGGNPIFPAITSLKSNIEGGIGIWCGYGAYTYRVDTKFPQ